MSEATWVYLIGQDGSSPVKIGYAADPYRRMQGLQVGNAQPLRLLWQTPGGRALELALHRHFAEYRVRGEWFDLGGLVPSLAVPMAAGRLVVALVDKTAASAPRLPSRTMSEWKSAALDVIISSPGQGIRSLARALDANPNMARKSLLALRDEGLVQLLPDGWHPC